MHGIARRRRQLLEYKKWAERAGSDIDRIMRLRVRVTTTAWPCTCASTARRRY
ncbi:unnamed protein product [Ectocarpus sp. 13 AM-2016]